MSRIDNIKKIFQEGLHSSSFFIIEKQRDKGKIDSRNIVNKGKNSTDAKSLYKDRSPMQIVKQGKHDHSRIRVIQMQKNRKKAKQSNYRKLKNLFIQQSKLV